MGNENAAWHYDRQLKVPARMVAMPCSRGPQGTLLFWPAEPSKDLTGAFCWIKSSAATRMYCHVSKAFTSAVGKPARILWPFKIGSWSVNNMLRPLLHTVWWTIDTQYEGLELEDPINQPNKVVMRLSFLESTICSGNRDMMLIHSGTKLDILKSLDRIYLHNSVSRKR